jgi:plastocyanin
MRKLLVSMLAAAILCVLAATALAATRSVKIGDNYFVRSKGVPTVTVSRNTTVKWNFKGDSVHNVTVSKGPVKFHSPTKDSGSYSKKLTRAGTYTIYCSIHGPDDQKMKLVVH